jgi:hypothetical protein
MNSLDIGVSRSAHELAGISERGIKRSEGHKALDDLVAVNIHQSDAVMCANLEHISPYTEVLVRKTLHDIHGDFLSDRA